MGERPERGEDGALRECRGNALARVGVRSYHDFALGIALLLIGAAVLQSRRVPRPIAYLMGLSGLTYLVQGWVVGADGFSATHTVLILVAWVLTLAWIIWLLIVAWRMQESEARPLPA